MSVLQIEGVHGAGKTTLIQTLKKLLPSERFDFLEERFMEYKFGMFEIDGAYAELTYVMDWFKRVAEWLSDEKNSEKVLICDRGPLSAVMYAKTEIKEQIYRLVQEMFSEMNRIYKWKNHIFVIKIPYEEVTKRIQERLKSEKERVRMKEDDEKHNESVYKTYKNLVGGYPIHYDDAVKDTRRLIKLIYGIKV